MVSRLDRHRRLAILPIDDAVSSRLLDGMSNAERHGSWHVVLPDGRVLNGARDASTVLLERLPATAWFARIVSRLRLQPLLEIVDRFFVWARRYLARIVPHGPGPKRFP